jgi:hypothetical protein
MKTTVYVPDDLWDRAKDVAPAASNPSQLVQSALTDWIRLKEPVSFEPFDVPDDDSVIDDAIYLSEHFRQAAQAAYDAGFAAAIQAAHKLSWSSLEQFAEIGFDLTDWTANIRDGVNRLLVEEHDAEAREAAIQSRLPAFEPLREHLGALVDPLADWQQIGVFLVGFTDSLRKLWGAAMQPSRILQTASVDGVYEEGGRVLHRKLGHGTVEAMQSRRLGHKTEVMVRFADGKRRRFTLGDDDLVGIPGSLSVNDADRRDPDELFRQLSDDREKRRAELRERLAAFRHDAPSANGETGWPREESREAATAKPVRRRKAADKPTKNGGGATPKTPK